MTTRTNAKPKGKEKGWKYLEGVLCSSSVNINKTSSGRDVMKFVLTVLHEAIEREMNQLPTGSSYVSGSMQRIYNSVKAIGIMYGITEKELGR